MMKWTIHIIFLSVIFSPLAKSNDAAGTDHDEIVSSALKTENVLEEISSVDKEIHSHSHVNPPDLNSNDRSITENLEERKLSDEIQIMENNGNDDSIQQNSVNDEHKQISSQDGLSQKDDVANLMTDNVLPVVGEGENLQEQKEKSHDADKDDNEPPITNTQENEKEASDLTSKTEENKAHSMDDESGVGTSTKKQRYFPLLFTFGSMFTSFLAEFGEVSGTSDSTSSNSSVPKNSTSEDGLALSSNTTSNSTEQGRKTRFQCALHLKNTTSELNGTSTVKIINSTELLEILNFSKNQKSAASPCVLVMFYTKWCHFSARAAPEYNALARAYPQLDVLAVDTSHFSYLNAKFGTVAVPNIMIFHSRSAVRFNHTTRDLDHFIQFVHNNTGLDPTSSVAVLPEDFEGPLSSKVVQGRDWLLWLAWAFILICSIYGFFFSLYGQAVIMRLRVLWAEHQHIE